MDHQYDLDLGIARGKKTKWFQSEFNLAFIEAQRSLLSVFGYPQVRDFQVLCKINFASFPHVQWVLRYRTNLT